MLQIRDAVGGQPWSEMSLEELARAAGLSRMTLHRRGVSRDDILAGLAQLLEREHAEAALPALASPAAAPARLAMILRAKCEVSERYLGLMTAFENDLQAIYHEPGEGEVLTRGPFVDAIRRILQDGEREQTLTCRGDLDETATLLFNAAGWTYREMRNGHRWPPEKARDQVVDLLVAGMRA